MMYIVQCTCVRQRLSIHMTFRQNENKRVDRHAALTSSAYKNIHVERHIGNGMPFSSLKCSMNGTGCEQLNGERERKRENVKCLLNCSLNFRFVWATRRTRANTFRCCRSLLFRCISPFFFFQLLIPTWFQFQFAQFFPISRIVSWLQWTGCARTYHTRMNCTDVVQRWRCSSWW